jgi:hypothetical protein
MVLIVGCVGLALNVISGVFLHGKNLLSVYGVPKVADIVQSMTTVQEKLLSRTWSRQCLTMKNPLYRPTK